LTDEGKCEQVKEKIDIDFLKTVHTASDYKHSKAIDKRVSWQMNNSVVRCSKKKVTDDGKRKMLTD
jgi:hypothetical protein